MSRRIIGGLVLLLLLGGIAFWRLQRPAAPVLEVLGHRLDGDAVMVEFRLSNPHDEALRYFTWQNLGYSPQQLRAVYKEIDRTMPREMASGSPHPMLDFYDPVDRDPFGGLQDTEPFRGANTALVALPPGAVVKFEVHFYPEAFGESFVAGLEYPQNDGRTNQLNALGLKGLAQKLYSQGTAFTEPFIIPKPEGWRKKKRR